MRCRRWRRQRGLSLKCCISEEPHREQQYQKDQEPNQDRRAASGEEEICKHCEGEDHEPKQPELTCGCDSKNRSEINLDIGCW